MASGIARLCYCRVSRFKRDRTTGLSSRTAREVTISVTSALAGVTLPQTPYLRNYEVVRGCWRPRRDRCGCCQDLTLVASVARRRELQCRCRCRTSDAHLVRPSGRGPLCYGDQMNSRQSEASRSPVCRHHFRQFTINAPIYAGAGKCCAPRVDSPSFKSTAFETIWTWAGFKPSRAAVMVIVPGVRVDRTATRLMPSSVFR
jgi:hypothetical protein